MDANDILTQKAIAPEGNSDEDAVVVDLVLVVVTAVVTVVVVVVYCETHRAPGRMAEKKNIEGSGVF